MPAISQKIPFLVGGVSQQPDSVMLPGQFRECENYYPDPSFGLQKRPGTKFIKHLNNSSGDGSWFYISKGPEDKLVIQVSHAGVMTVWDGLSGVQQVLNDTASSVAYATHQDAADIEMLEINDYVFFLNRKVTVEDTGTSSPAQSLFAFIKVNTVASETSYDVKLDGTLYTYNVGAAPTNLSVKYILNGLDGVIPSGTYTKTIVGNCMIIKRNNNADFDISASGGVAGNGLEAFKGTVTGVESLPGQFGDGYILKVAGSADSADDYYLKFETSDGSATGAGSWVETIAPDTPLGLDAETMPHALIQEADGTYTFRELSEAAANAYVTLTSVTGIPTAVSVTSNGTARWNIGQTFAVYGGTGINLRLKVTSINNNRQITGVEILRAGQGYTATDVVNNLEGDTFTITTVATQTLSGSTWADQFWGQRSVGDEDSSQSPSFVGSQITGISSFKNRLVLTSQENVVCSRAGEFLEFYPSSVLTTVASDPIDLSAGATTRLQFRHALQHPNGLMVFGDSAQYILQTRTEAFSPATAELNLVSSFTHSSSISPIDLGSTFLTIDENNTSVTVNELTVNVDVSPLKKDLTKVIPSYIPNGIIQISNSLTAALFGLVSVQTPNNIYLFRYYTQDNERFLSSWFKWTFPGEVVLFELVESEAYIVLKADNEFIFLQMSLLTESPGGAILFENKYIDLRLDVFDYNPTTFYDAGLDQTKVFFREGAEIASAVPCLVQITANDSSYVLYPDLEEDLGAPVGEQYYVLVDGDQTAQEFALGYQFTSEIRFPSFYVKRDKLSDDVNVPVIHRVKLYSHESGPFEISLDVPGRAQFNLTLPQITANLSEANQAPMLRTAENIIPILAKGTDADLRVHCISPFPLSLVSLTWEGTYNNKGIKAV